ncbi:MAG: methyltransferase domain-containing protein [Saprospirales bacterium]|nr:MAG: methyltransferase domain-containing protein [Saprospirales bacterium]
MKNRSQEKELMDGPLADPQVLYKNLDEIAFINKFTAHYSLQLNQIKKLIPKGSEEIEIVDLGCGGGDFLFFLEKNRSKLPAKLLLSGLDTEPHAIAYAEKKFPSLRDKVSWIQKDYKEWLESEEKTDIICCNLFCHHLRDEDIVDLLKKGSQKARLGLIINDLHRHPLAFHFIKIATRLFSSSDYTKNDAPLSVKRSFKREDWENFFDRANGGQKLVKGEIRWLPSFRFLVTATRASS